MHADSTQSSSFSLLLSKHPLQRGMRSDLIAYHIRSYLICSCECEFWENSCCILRFVLFSQSHLFKDGAFVSDYMLVLFIYFHITLLCFHFCVIFLFFCIFCKHKIMESIIYLKIIYMNSLFLCLYCFNSLYCSFVHLFTCYLSSSSSFFYSFLWSLCSFKREL